MQILQVEVARVEEEARTIVLIDGDDACMEVVATAAVAAADQGEVVDGVANTRHDDQSNGEEVEVHVGVQHHHACTVIAAVTIRKDNQGIIIIIITGEELLVVACLDCIEKQGGCCCCCSN